MNNKRSTCSYYSLFNFQYSFFIKYKNSPGGTSSRGLVCVWGTGNAPLDGCGRVATLPPYGGSEATGGRFFERNTPVGCYAKKKSPGTPEFPEGEFRCGIPGRVREGRNPPALWRERSDWRTIFREEHPSGVLREEEIARNTGTSRRGVSVRNYMV